MYAISDELRAQLDAVPLRPLAEYLAERFDSRFHTATVELVFEGGNLERAFVKAGPIRKAELDALRRAPRLNTADAARLADELAQRIPPAGN